LQENGFNEEAESLLVATSALPTIYYWLCISDH